MSPLNRVLRHSNPGQILCPICHEPVKLETSKTDEDGRATHEECYTQSICSKKQQSKEHSRHAA